MFFRSVLCNILVCMAIWMAFAGRSVIDKAIAIVFPISAFVAAGFEHSIANMYFVPIALFIKALDPAFIAASGVDVSRLTWGSFLTANLFPVTLGNIIGGTLLVAATYWFVFLRRSEG